MNTTYTTDHVGVNFLTVSTCVALYRLQFDNFVNWAFNADGSPLAEAEKGLTEIEGILADAKKRITKERERRLACADAI